MINVMVYLLVFVELLVSLLLIAVILVQKTKSQGIGMAFGAGMGESLFGSQVGNVLTKTTVILAAVFLVNTTLLAILGGGRRRESVAESIVDHGIPEPATAPSPGPPPMQPSFPNEMPFSTDQPMLPDISLPDIGEPGTDIPTTPAGDASQPELPNIAPFPAPEQPPSADE